jgi:hypothetical protein
MLKIGITINFFFVVLWVQNVVLCWLEQHKSQVSEKQMLSRTFGPKQYELRKQFKMLHSKEFKNCYKSGI